MLQTISMYIWFKPVHKTPKNLEIMQMKLRELTLTPKFVNLDVTRRGICKRWSGEVLQRERDQHRRIQPMDETGYLSRFQTEARADIFNYAKRILRFLIGTLDYGLEYKSKGRKALTCFVDASFASAKDAAYESTTGFVIFSYGNLVTWNSKKQSSAQTSTAAVEYTAMNDASKELIFILYLIANIFKISDPATVYKDNTSAIDITEGTETTELRFLLTRLHQIRKMVKRGEIEILHLPGNLQIIDLLTKSCTSKNFIDTWYNGEYLKQKKIFCKVWCSYFYIIT